MHKGSLFVISGPSGAGKGTLISRLVARVPNVWVSISATTRDPREGEVDGKDYIFATDAEFDQLVASDGLLEWAQVHDRRYGTPRALVEQHLASGNHVVLEIDVQGGFQVREKMPGVHLVFIEPPSLAELERRLRARNTDSEESIRVRMRNAEMELSRKAEYDVCLLNDDLDACFDALVAYIERQAMIDEEI